LHENITPERLAAWPALAGYKAMHHWRYGSKQFVQGLLAAEVVWPTASVHHDACLSLLQIILSMPTHFKKKFSCFPVILVSEPPAIGTSQMIPIREPIISVLNA
jgi:hypothetical protein